MFVKRVTY